MSSPPSLDKLHISSPPPCEAQASPKPEEDGESPSSLSTSASADKPLPNGDASKVPPPPSTAASPLANGALPRPPPIQAAASTPVLPSAAAGRPPPGGGIPGRPGAPGGARGGMPMPMGMRGVAGRPAMQSKLPPSLQKKMDEIAAQRGSAPSPHTGPTGPNPNATSMAALLRAQALGGAGGGGGGGGAGAAAGGPSLPGPSSGPLSSLAARRAAAGGPPRPSLGAMGMGASAPGGIGGRGAGVAGRRMGPPGGLSLSGMGGPKKEEGNKFTDFGKIMDPSGSLRFSSKAVLHAKGVDFADGISLKINMDEMEVVGELGKGNYGAVQLVNHRPTGVMMAMKEIRLELDESKLNGIIMELDILHRAVAPEIVEFFGAFTIESCVYYCMEYMDAGSLDTLTGGGLPVKPGEEEVDAELRVPEPVLRRITAAMTRGLKFLKDELQIMHRDVKPTNVLINKKGEVKLCDFGVSGQLEKSLAKTNIGCQSYMAPERIKGESQNQIASYTVSSDVWSVGLSIIELAKGCYPYPPETFANVFAQLQAIVYGPAPMLPKGYSDVAQDFVAKCLLKDPNARPTYGQMLQHPFLTADVDADVDMAGWVALALERRGTRGVVPIEPPEA